MINDIEIFLKNFVSSWQMARIYQIQHPKFTESLQPVCDSLRVVLGVRKELVIGIFGEELAAGEDIFFDLSKQITLFIFHLKEMGIERMVFGRGIAQQEMAEFISFLITPKERIKNQPQEYLVGLGIKNIEVGKLKAQSRPGARQIKEVVTKASHYENCLGKASQSFNLLLDEDTVEYLNLRFVANTIGENLSSNYQSFFGLVQTKNYDAMTFKHLLNVSILSMYLSQKLGLSREDCLDIGIAALFHDIGKLYISRKIIRKTGVLDKEEFARIKSHTILGAEILLRHVDNLTILPVVVAFEHHLGYDLNGYPKASFSLKPHIASLIVSICDVYDALAQRRTYKRDYPPELIHTIMARDRGKKFSPQIFDRFFQSIGVWPRGTIVLLEDGRIAIVREENEGAIFSPRIDVISESAETHIDASKVLSINLKKERGVKIKRSLNPLNEGKKYLDLI